MARSTWCEECKRLWPDSELGEGRVCPGCGTSLARRPSTWRFRFFLFASAVYLTWRLGQGLDWLARYIGRH